MTTKETETHAPARRHTGWLRRWLASEKAPFLLALLLAALAWCVTRVADRAVALPIIEYDDIRLSALPKPIDQYRLCEVSNGLHAYAFSIRNISKQVAFMGLEARFLAEEGRVITEARWADHPPGLAEPEMPPCNAEKSRARSLTLGQLEPGWSGFCMVWTNDPKPPLLIFKLPRLGEGASESRAVYLMKANLTTWIMWHEFALYYSAIVLLMALVIWYGTFYAKKA